MAGEWKRLALADAIDLISGGTPKTNVPDYWDGDIPWLSVADFNTGYRWVSTAEKSITERGLTESATAVLNQGDIIISARGTVGVVAQLAKPMAFNQSCYGVRGRQGIAETNFLYYALRHAVSGMKQVAHGGVFDTITRDTFKIIEVDVPVLPEQRAIAHILSTLDDKIELNRRMSETLEAMARALFKTWFVDFDPVRARAEGRDPGLPAHLADLFPDSFEDSELGEIPRGWEVAPLPDAIEVNPNRPLRKGDVAPYLDMANMPTRGHTPDEVVDRPFGSGMRFKDGDTLVARITPCLENGKTAYVDFLGDEQVGWGSTEYIVLRPKPPLPLEFAYCLARSNEFREFAIQSMTGSSGRQRVPAEALSQYLIAAPGRQIAEHFGRIVAPIFARASAAARESRTLSTARDTLLPKLISGELRVKDAERFTAGVT